MALDYSKVIMVGRGWATRDKSGKFTMFATAFEAAGGKVDDADDAEPDPKLIEWLATLEEKPKVADAKEAGFDVSGSDLTDAWAEAKPE